MKPLASVQAFDLLCEVQSDKASVEITSPFDGIVKELLVQEGELAKVGEGLCLIETDEDIPANSAELAPVEPVALAADKPAEPTSLEEILEPTEQEEGSHEEPVNTRRLHPLDPNYTPETVSTASSNVLATPSVRHFSRQKGVDLGKLAPGTGKGGRIEKKDVEAYLASGTVGGETKVEDGKDVVVELGRTRYGMWKTMVKVRIVTSTMSIAFGANNVYRAWRSHISGTFYLDVIYTVKTYIPRRYSTTLDLTAIHVLIPSLNTHIPPHFLPPNPESSSSPVDSSALYPAPSPERVPPSSQYTRLTYLPILLKTLSKAMHQWPLFRSSITPSTSTSTDNSQSKAKPTLTVRPHADISIALSTPTGLYTPTLRHVDRSSIYALSSQLKHLAHLGRQVPCALTPNDMPKRGGTLTVSNIGAIAAADFASPVLVPGGGVAIVAIGQAKWVWDVDSGDGKGQRRLKVGVSWSADHRIVEGAELAAFVECWRAYVEAPERLIAEGV